MEITKTERVLLLFDRLNKGEIIYKREWAQLHGVNEKSVQRDFDDIRAFLSEHKSNSQLIYSRADGGYRLTNVITDELPGVEILAIGKILLASRALNKDEMLTLLTSLINRAPNEDRKLIQANLLNEIHHYVPLQHNRALLKLIWDLGTCIVRQYIIAMEYEKPFGTIVNRNVKPVSILFSNYYFYLVAYRLDSDYEEPAYFRADRIRSFTPKQEHFRESAAKRFEAGVLRKEIQFMTGGKRMTIRFIYTNANVEPVLDQFPTAQAVPVEKGYLITAEVFGDGCMMWLLGQGSKVKVLSPDSLKKKMIDTIQEMAHTYLTDH